MSQKLCVWIIPLCLILYLCPLTLVECKQKEVVIIGAGLSGATVARQLVNDPHSRYKVTLLEGREERFGGRLWTQTEAPGAMGADADLGGSIIDGSDPHGPLIELIKKFELTLTELGPLEIRSPKGSERHNANELVETIQRHLISKIQSAIIKRDSTEDFSVQEAISMMGEEKSVDDALWDVVLDGIIEPTFGVGLENLSASHFQLDKLSGGFVITEGATELVNRLISGWGTETILDVEMGKVVRQIQITERTKKVKVRTLDRRSITADILVVAVPLSVLKSGELFFDPPLSSMRKKAIQKTGVGHLNKVILRFKEPFWDLEPGMFSTTAEILKSAKPLISTWLNGYQLTNSPSLIGYVSGQRAKLMEEMDEVQLKAEALKSLELIFGKSFMMNQKVVSMQRSEWSGDPLAGGSASFFAVGNDNELRKQAFRPLCSYLYFAGEYATLDKPGTIEGAYFSGLEVADQIMNGCRDGEKPPRKNHQPDEL